MKVAEVTLDLLAVTASYDKGAPHAHTFLRSLAPMEIFERMDLLTECSGIDVIELEQLGQMATQSDELSVQMWSRFLLFIARMTLPELTGLARLYRKEPKAFASAAYAIIEYMAARDGGNGGNGFLKPEDAYFWQKNGGRT